MGRTGLWPASRMGAAFDPVGRNTPSPAPRTRDTAYRRRIEMSFVTWLAAKIARPILTIDYGFVTGHECRCQQGQICGECAT